MPSSSQHTFVLVLDGSQAVSQAQNVANQIASALVVQVNTGQLVDASQTVSGLQAAITAVNASPVRVGVAQTSLQQLQRAEQQLATIDQLTTKILRKAGWSGTAQQWTDASRIEQYASTLAQAYANTWGLRRAAYELQARGRELLFTGGAILGAEVMAGKQFVDYAEGMNAVARVMGATAELTDEFDLKLRTLADTMTLLDPKDWAEGLYTYVAATGASIAATEELDDTLQQSADIAKLAKLGRVDYAKAVTLVTDVESQFQMNVSETEHVVATLLRTADASKATVDSLAESFKFIGPRAHSAGVTFEEVAAALQVLANAGVRGSMGGRGLGRLLENIIAPSQQAQKIMDATFGERAFEDYAGNFIGLSSSIALITDKLAGMTSMQREAVIAAITTENAARALTPIINQQMEARKLGLNVIEQEMAITAGVSDKNTEAYRRLIESVYGYSIASTGAAEQMKTKWEAYLASINGKVDAFNASWKSALYTIGKSVMESLIGPMEVVAGLMDRVVVYTTGHPNVGAVATIIGASLVTLGGLLTVLSRPIMLYADYKMVQAAIMNRTAANDAVRAAREFGLYVQELRVALGGTAAATHIPVTPIYTPATMLTGLLGGLSSIALQVGVAYITAKAISGLIEGAVAPGGALTPTSAVDRYAAMVKTDTYQREYASHYKLYSGFTMEELQRAATYIRGQLSSGDWGGEQLVRLQAWLDAVIANINRIAQDGPAAMQATGEATGGWLDSLDGVDKVLMASLRHIEDVRIQMQVVIDGMQAAAGLEKVTLEGLPKIMEDAAASAGKLLDIPWGDIPLDKQQVVMEEARIARDAMLEDLALLPQRALEEGWTTGELQTIIDQIASKYTTAMDELVETVSAESPWEKLREGAISSVTSSMGDLLVAGLSMDEVQTYYDDFLDRLEALGIRAATMSGDAARWMVDAFVANFRTFLDTVSDAAMKLSNLRTSLEEQGWSLALGLADVYDPQKIQGFYAEYAVALDDFLRRTKGMQGKELEAETAVFLENWQDRKEGIRDYYTTAERSAKDAIKKAKEDYTTWRSFVAGLLQPTEVTALDVAQTSVGAYEDKWDEYVRRLRDAQTNIFSPFRKMIPTDIEQAGQPYINLYVEKEIEAFFSGQRLDKVNWDALIAEYDKQVAAKAGKEKMVDILTQKLIATGRTPQEGAVRQALGLTSPLELAVFGGQPPEEVGKRIGVGIDTAMAAADVTTALAPLSTSVANALNDGIAASIGDKSLILVLAASWKTDIEANKSALVQVGWKVGLHMWDGMLEALGGSNLLSRITWAVLDALEKQLESLGLEPKKPLSTTGP